MKIGRSVYSILGITLVVVGFIGAVVPVMPSTVFLIMALFCFKKSNARLENWLLNHRVFGPTLRAWEETKSMALNTKIIAIAMMWIFGSISAVIVGTLWVKGAIVLLCFAGTCYILTRKTTQQKKSSESVKRIA